MTLVARVSERLDALAPAGASCLVAVSGGPDSLALLDLLWQGREVHRRRLVIGHVEHGIQSESADGLGAIQRWLDTQMSMDLGELPKLLVVRLSLGPGTTETKARVARQQALRAMAQESSTECIALAHHAADQAETVLLRLLRGSGPAGLAAMSPRRGLWLRPLLDEPPDVLRRHLVESQIDFWDDPANTDPKHLRSWLRQTVLPPMIDRLPDLPERLITAGRHAATARRAWDEVPELLPDLSLQQENHGISVAATVLSGYSSVLRTMLLGTLGRRFGVSLGDRRIRAVEALLRGGKGRADLDARLEVELAFGRLTFRRPITSDAPPLPLHDGVVWGEYRFSLRPGRVGTVGRATWGTWLRPGEYQIRGWRAGDKIRPLGGTGTRPLGVLLKEAKVPPRERKGWPVVTSGDSATILWVPGICRSDEDVPQEDALAIHVDCIEC